MRINAPDAFPSGAFCKEPSTQLTTYDTDYHYYSIAARVDSGLVDLQVGFTASRAIEHAL